MLISKSIYLNLVVRQKLSKLFLYSKNNFLFCLYNFQHLYITLTILTNDHILHTLWKYYLPFNCFLPVKPTAMMLFKHLAPINQTSLSNSLLSNKRQKHTKITIELNDTPLASKKVIFLIQINKEFALVY